MRNQKGKVHNYRANMRKDFEKNQKVRRKKLFILVGLAVVLVIGGIGIYSAFSPKGENKEAAAAQNNGQDDKDNKKSSDKSGDGNPPTKEESNLDNSGYIPLKDDPNAEDAKVVADRTLGLQKGNLHYPVRDDGKKVVYLTFDDGPSTTNTPEILDILKENDVKATFFVTGKSVEANDTAKSLLKREASEGHAIANHSYSHEYKYLYPNRVINPDNFMEEYNKTNNLLKETLGKDFSTTTVRFPGGYWSWNGRESIRPTLDKEGIAIAEWNALNGDAEGNGKSTPEQLVQKTKKTVTELGPNADSVIFLMHDTYGKGNTVKALPEIIEFFKSEGYEFKTMK
ncbi:polysaccharide deacetylase family protein [Clostridium sp.]|uniref:polysaccharide deacetylase family protein n=1 Tax=Clostridium sp. TaxID=1506 RepID=UPI002FC8F7C2